MTAIVTHRLTRTFGPRRAVAEVSVSVARGEVLGLLGHNGAGKTTTLRLVNGILSPTSGSVQVFGRDPYLDGQQVRGRTGVLTESPALDGQLTVSENLRMYGTIAGLDEVALRRATTDKLERLSLAEFADERAGSLSAGLKQRVALARALLHDPELLLLDEPTSSLDPVAARQVRDLVRGLTAEGRRTVVLCTHNLAEAQELCDRVAILQRGQVVAQGTTRELGARASAGATISIVVDREPDERTTEQLRSVPGVTSVAVGPEELRVGRRHPDVTPEVVAVLVRAGVGIHRVDDVPVSLEEVYLRLHSEEHTEEVDPSRPAE